MHRECRKKVKLSYLTKKTQEEIETDHKFYLFHDYCKNSEQMLLTELQICS